MKRFFKYLIRTILAIVVLLFVVLSLLYLPVVQRYIKIQLEGYASSHFGWVVNIGTLSVGFPLDVVMEDVFAGKSRSDTLLSAEKIQVNVGIRHLLWQKLSVEDLSLQRVKFCFTNDSTGLLLDVEAGNLNLRAEQIDLPARRILITDLQLADGVVLLKTGDKTTADTVAGKPFDWTFVARRIGFTNINFRMATASLPALVAGAGTGLITGGEVSIGQQYVNVDTVEVKQGHCSIRTAPASEVAGTEKTNGNPTKWTIRAGTVLMGNSDFSLTSGEEKKMEIILSGIGVRLDSVYNRGTVVRAALKDLQVVQRGGLQVESMRADINLDTARTQLSGVYIKTENSVIRLDARTNTSVTGLMGDVPLEVALDAHLGLVDLQPFYTGIPLEIRHKSVDINTAFVLSGNQIRVSRFTAFMPGHFQLSGRGDLSSLRNLKTVSGTFDLAGDLADVSFVNSLLGKGIAIPRNLTLSLNVKAIEGIVNPQLRLCLDGGCLSVDGRYQISRQEYQANVDLADFPLEHFMPNDSLGRASVGVELSGRNFDPVKAEARVVADVRHLLFKRHDYQDIHLEADLKRTHFTAILKSGDPDLAAEFYLKADSVGKQYIAELNGTLVSVNPARLNLMSSSPDISLNLAAKAGMAGKDVFFFHTVLDQIQMGDGKTNKLGDIRLNVDSDPGKTNVDLISGDFYLAFQGDTAIQPVIRMFTTVAAEAAEQFRSGSFDMEKLQAHLPVFTLEAKGAEDNTISKYLKAKNIGFKTIGLNISSLETAGFRIRSKLEQPYFNKMAFDSICLNVLQEDKALAYSLEVGNSIEDLKDILNINASGKLQKEQLRLELKQKDRQGQIGLDLGFDFTLRDSTLAVSLFPMTPIIGYSRWILNTGNRVVFTKDRKVIADLKLIYREKEISLLSLPDEGTRKDRLALKIAGIDLSGLAATLPFIPDVSGFLNTNLLLYTQEEHLGADGEIGIADFYYTGQRVGNVELKTNYTLGNRFSDHAIHFELQLDSIKRALIQGQFSTAVESGKEIFADIELPSLPLEVVNVFVPDNLIHLGGELTGAVQVRGTLDKPVMNGALRFLDGRAELVMLGTVFRFDTSRIVLRNSRILFDKYRFFAPNKSSLMVNGVLDMASFAHIMTDLALTAKDFQVVDVKQNSRSLIYGKAYANVNATMKGEFSSLNVAGNVSLLNNTVIDYTLRSSDPELKDRSLDLVRFVSFRDTTLSEKDLLTNRIRASNFGLKLLIEIGSNVKMNVNLSEDGGDKVAIQGGGNLIYSMEQEGGTSLIGKYTLTGGTVSYNIPVAGRKVFNIRTGSSVEWTGNLSNPRFSIAASEAVTVSVVEAGQTARLVNFDAIIRIQNTLQEPEITFDLSTPSDVVIQNQLDTYSPEERTKLAMNLLITGSYTPPGAVAPSGSNTAGNALNSFVESELNQWTRKYLKNSGLTFGVDTYNTGEETKRTDVSYQFNKQLFNDKVNVKIGGRVSTDSEPGGNDAMGQNLVDDISIEYVFDKNRKLFLKVFRHTNYESVLEGEVTQTGVGVVWRKSFRKVMDVFRRKSAEGSR